MGQRKEGSPPDGRLWGDLTRRVRERLRPAARRLGARSGSLVSRAYAYLEPRLRPLYEAVRREWRGLTFREAARRVGEEVLMNPRRRKAAYALVVTTWVAAIVWGRLLAPLAAAPFLRPAEAFTVVGYFENGTGGFFEDSLPALEAAPRGLFDVVSPFWYNIGPEGGVVERGFREEVVRLARSRGMRVIPLVNNLKTGPGNGLEVLTDRTLRRRTADELGDLVARRGYDGLALSFELIPPEGREGFSAFVRELAGILHTQGKVLHVLVFSDVELPRSVSGLYDYQAIGEAADRVVLLSFDRHWTLTDPGPLSPLPWVEAGVESLLRHVPRNKVILGIGTHAYDWPVDPDAGVPEFLPTAAALRRAELTGADVRHDPESGQSFFTYKGSTGVERVVWVQDTAHLVERAELARRLGLRGVALWRLGYSEEGALEALARALGRGP